ncbi:MAG: PEGA domain-containing protein, partial [Thermoanaerobaculia bacterium]|nr:PEGA domain-containing protein [Thermoanaerobaculia bacterium]
TVATRPQGAKVFLNDQEVSGRTPTEIQLVPGEEYEVRVDLAEYHPEAATFDFPDGLDADIRESKEIFFPLRTKIPPGKLTLQADYSFRVDVGGRNYGPSRSHNISLRPDTYEVHVTSAEVFLDQRRQIRVSSNQTARLDVPAAVTIRVAAQPGNCKVYIRGRLIDETPFSQRLIPGNYDFRFEWPALGQSRTYSEIVSAQNTEIFGTLE